MIGSYTIEDDSVFISQSTQIWGKVSFGRDSSAWFDTIFRSVQGLIEVGQNSHIDDQARIYNSQNSTMRIGSNVYISYRCSLSDCEIGDNSYIGECSTIYPGAIIPRGSFIAPHSLVIGQAVFPENSFIQGSPAYSISNVAEEMSKEYRLSLTKMQREVRFFRTHYPQAEQVFYLLQFSIPSQHSEKVLEALFEAGAGDIFQYQGYHRTLGHKLEYVHKDGQRRTVRQELSHTVVCPGHKLQTAIQVLCGFPNHIPIYQVSPLSFYSFQPELAKKAAPRPPVSAPPAGERLQSRQTPAPPPPDPVAAPKPAATKTLADTPVELPAPDRIPSPSSQVADAPVAATVGDKKIKEMEPVLDWGGLVSEFAPEKSKIDLMKASSSEENVFMLYPEFFNAENQLRHKDFLPDSITQTEMLREELYAIKT
ncbi:MAG: hypothetical protein AAF975_06510 [Spirochaetota bacterium]